MPVMPFTARASSSPRTPSKMPRPGIGIIITLENYLAQLGAWVTIVQGVIFVICVLTFRRGVVGEIGNWLKKPL